MSTTLLLILILEDEAAHAEAILRAFEASPTPVEIRTAASLKEYCEMLAQQVPDIVLMDLNLPDGNPMESLTLLSESNPFPVLVMTSCGNEEVAVAAMKLGALDYMVKSAEAFADMPRTVQRVLREWNLLQSHKRAEAAVRESLREKEELLKEIHHRVKNNLQIVSSLLRLQASRIDNPVAKHALQNMQNRVRSMSLIHEHLYRSDNMARVDLSAYLKSLCQQLVRTLTANPGDVQLVLDLAPVELEIDQAIPCGLLVNELVANALKHAFPEGSRTGELRVELRPVEGGQGWRLRVADNGVGLPEDFALTSLSHLSSLGLQLVTDLTRQIGGKLEIGSGPGAVFEVVFQEIRSS